MKRLLIAIAAAATTLFAPAAVLESEDFESSSWTGVTAAEYGEETPVALQYPFTATNAKYGVLDDVATSPEAEGATWFDMYVQFTPMTEKPSVDEDAKIAVYVDSEGNVHVISDGTDYTTGETVDPGEWKRLTIAEVATGYKVYVDGTAIQGEVENSDPISVFPAESGATYVTFTGSGKLDNFVARTTDPFAARGERAVAVGEFATGGEYFAGVSNEAIAAAAAVGLPLKLYGNAALTATLNAGDSFILDKGSYELTGLGDKYTVNGNTYTRVSAWSDYLGDAVAGAYEIDNLTELKAFQANVGTLPTANLTFKLTADIALDAAWPGIGIQNGKDIVSKAEFDNGAFTGTYDGGNYTISNFQMVDGLDYCGFFNSVKGATIKNLKISYKDGSFAKDMVAAKEVCGATFVGVAKASTLQNLTSLAGTVSCTKGFGGIVGYLMAGSTVDSCTNNVNLTSTASNKAGGIAMITQSGSGTATIRNCQNNGTTAGNANQKGGIVGYVGVATEIADCEDTAGSDPSFLHHQSGTLTMTGVNKAPAGVKSYTKNATNIDGLNLATVDNGVATFVKSADLVLGKTYKVMGPGAAYMFEQAGTLTLDQSLATATVTADTSKFVFTTSEPVGNVTTYTAVAGVASVGGQAYATLAEAVAVAGPNDVITILANIPAADCKVFNRAGEFRVKYDTTYMTVLMALGGADGYLMPAQPATEAGDTIVVYTIVEGVAKVDGRWYASFSAAYTAAQTEGSSLVVKVGSEGFTPTFPEGSGNEVAKTFASIEFINTDDAQIAIATTAGGKALTAATWVAPANATLTLESQTVTSVAAGTLNVPAGVTLRTADGGAFAGVSNLTGTGRVVVSGTAPAGSLQALCQKQGWTGTLELANVDIGSACNLKLFGNANSTVCFNNVGCALTANNESVHAIGTLEIGASGFELIGNYSGGVFTLPCAVTGTGTFKVSAKDSAYGTDRKDVKFTGDVSGFTGNITFDDAANARVVFGTGTYPSAAAAKCIIVTPGTELTLPSAATWSAPTGIIVQGGLDVQGTLDVPANNIYGTGVIKFHAANKAVRAADSWEGTYRIDWVVPSGAFTIGDYGRKANGTIEIMQSPNNKAYPAPLKLTVVPTVKLSADWTVNDGWHSADGESTFTKLTGSGNLTVNGTTSGNQDIWYTFTTLENYTGTLGGNRGKFKIGTLVSSVDPQPGAKLVSLKSGTREFRDLDQTVVKYNNETVEVELEQKDDGIYVALPPAAKVAEIVGGEQFETLAGALAAAADGATVKLLDNITLDARVEPNVGANTSLTIDLGGYTITREGTGGNGSVFDVKSGNVVITNGVIDCTQDDTAIVAGGVYAITARSGANVTLDSLTVTVDSQAGACVYPFAGATVTILGGTYGNDTAEEYQYKKNWIGMAVNQANVATQLITISGGSFYKVDPALGDDSWADGAGTFLAEGYETSYDSQTGYYVVSKSAGGFPGGEDGKTFTIDDAVQTALEAKLPAGKALTDTVEGTTSGLTYAQAYALDLFDEDTGTVEDVKPTIEIVNGKVVVSLDATAKAGYKVMLNVYEKSSLTAQWPTEPTKSYELDSAAEAAGFAPSAAGAGFYKVGVTIEDAE